MGTTSGTNENEHQGQLQDAVLQHPPVVLHTASVTGGDVGPERHDSELANVKEEEWEGPEPAHMKERELELQLPRVKEEEQELPFIGIVVKSEDDVSQQEPESPQAKEEEEELTEMPPTGKEGLRREEGGGTGPLGRSSTTPEGGPGHPGRSRADGLLAPLSDHRHDIWHSGNNREDDGGHSGSVSCQTDNLRWTCSQCDKTFEAKSDLKMHTGEKALACSLCSQGAPLTNSIEEKHFACSVCHLKFRKQCNLKAHIRTHTGEKPFACSVCEKRFTEKGHLRTHSRTHTGEKPFACSVCEQRFSEKGSLRKHARTHSGEKPFACLVCAKTFTQKGHLRRHSRTHSGEKPFSCNVCAKRFANKYQVTIHHCAGGEKSSGHQASNRQ
ncbi:gastrula zinc finger protein 5-1-like isoform X1 [Syngnathus typhle]|uniref:gastrula zinc finger protein 5-1-like isoform X1 n=2 Tax=Syngnathus typhle TaxID=161592 RepID=UPI002A6B786B|nr:gastrula zinc finger protein 5-1-like isoform X1 [Syngnathus typhle]